MEGIKQCASAKLCGYGGELELGYAYSWKWVITEVIGTEFPVPA